MAAYKKEISRDEYLKALALFTVAHEHYCDAVRFGKTLNKIIMTEPEQFPGGHVDDAIYSTEVSTVAEFDEALKREGIAVGEAEEV